MCDALRELMKDELAQARREGVREGFCEGYCMAFRKCMRQIKQSLLNGELEGAREMILKLPAKVMRLLFLDADDVMDILRIPAEERETFRARLP